MKDSATGASIRKARSSAWGKKQPESRNPVQTYLSLALQNISKRSFVFSGSATVVQDGTRSSGIDHSLHSHNVSPCLPNNFTSKMGKKELRDPVGPSPPPYPQLPFISESLTPFTKEQGSPESHSNRGKVNCNQYLLTFPFLPPANSKAYLLGKPGRQEVE